MPGSVLGTGDVTEHRTNKSPCPVELTFLSLLFFICEVLKKFIFSCRFISEEADLHFLTALQDRQFCN